MNDVAKFRVGFNTAERAPSVLTILFHHHKDYGKVQIIVQSALLFILKSNVLELV